MFGRWIARHVGGKAQLGRLFEFRPPLRVVVVYDEHAVLDAYACKALAEFV